ncbi:Coenzyme F420 hydrogenase/dehydrogenase, beta subunit C-terminal domain [Sphingobium estronivorans]|uniref:Coenzyme F420 hydrogenase/dehydrogenase, beta subunit C-terminal domain n=1 Tax=Sphingobium estronivorans TaxID=1577690 RepID=UPI00123A23A7|nr:Coenzyme F420 hydrogenase/dehydrogenase, beta subunit C-terminal domain [Sphingobium estronivorans]
MIASSPTLRRVERGALCAGCGLCAGIADGAVTMETVAPGYSRPRQVAPIAASVEARIAGSCPGSQVAPWQDAPHRHHSWGPWHRTMTGHAGDEGVRHAGSSGGALTALLTVALETGLVDRVLHVDADPDQPTRNRIRWSDSADEIIAGSGSRYAASSPLAAIDRALQDGARFAFVGKPCDVSALRQYARFDPRVAAQVPVMLSFFCGGLPSHDGADRIIRAMGLEPDEIVQFRYRGHGWPGLTRAVTADGRSGEMRYADSWGRHLSSQVQFRCKICPDAVGGVADIACADAWYGGESGYPTFEEQAGRSLIMTRSLVGEALLDMAMARGAIVAEPLDIAEVDLMQPAQARRKRMVRARLAASLATAQPRPAVTGLDVGKAARTARWQESLSNFAGTARRIILGRR